MRFPVIYIVVMLLPILASADNFPIPGFSVRTNSQECIDKFKSIYTLGSSVFNNVPASSSVQRLDILVGGIPSSSGFDAIEHGKKYQTEYYSMLSTYAIPGSDAFVGKQEIGFDYQKPTEIRIRETISLQLSSSIRSALYGETSSCSTSRKFSSLQLMIQQGAWPASTCSLNLSFSKSSSDSICTTGTQTMSQLVVSKKPSLPGSPKLKKSIYCAPSSGCTLSIAAKAALEQNGWTVSPGNQYLEKQLSYADVSTDLAVNQLVATNYPNGGPTTYVDSSGNVGTDWSAICSPGGVTDSNCFGASDGAYLEFPISYGSSSINCMLLSDWSLFSTYYNVDWGSLSALQSAQASARQSAFQYRNSYDAAAAARQFDDDIISSGMLNSATVADICAQVE